MEKQVDLEKNEWVAVAFKRGMFLGQFMEHVSEEDLLKIHFIERSSLSRVNSYVWPELSGKSADIYAVEHS